MTRVFTLLALIFKFKLYEASSLVLEAPIVSTLRSGIHRGALVIHSVLCAVLLTLPVLQKSNANTSEPQESREQVLRAASKEPQSVQSVQTSEPVSFKVKLSSQDGEASSLPQSVDRMQSLKISRGGESAGGGNLLELKLTAAVQRMYEGLKTSNPDGINLETLKFFIENTLIVLSSETKEFYLKNDVNSNRSALRDAVNFFPKQWLLKLYAPAWEKYFALNIDTEALLYHEFLLFFFNHDKQYVRSRTAVLGSSNRSILSLAIGKTHVDPNWSSDSIMVTGETLDRKEKISIYCSIGSLSQMHFYYYRDQKPLAHTNNSLINPFSGCEEFDEIKMRLTRGTPACPVIVDLDRKAIENGHIVLIGVRPTCK